MPKSSLFEGPRFGQPLTPPDTDVDYSNHLHASGQTSMGLGIDVDPPPSHISPSATEVPLNHQPRKPSVAYINSGLRESRERTIHRGLKWLVVVVPPPSFAQEHGHLGHTLSTGPTHRLSQGILMPLFPTMSSQLTAIAREFSFPSTAGLCLYLHTVQAGLSVTPRVSDESWSLLWSHLFDPRSPAPAPSQIPIGGRLEFDIDLRKARWYDSWLSIPRREMLDVPVSVSPSRPQTLSHFRGDSRTTFADDQGDDQLETISLMQQAKSRVNRHVPRKLSLLDRFDVASLRSGSKLNPRHHSPPSPTARSANLQALSPIVQEDSPLNNRSQLDQLVTSWRAASRTAPSPLAATDETSPPDSEPSSEINLADYTWSISSVGPPEYDDDLESIASWDRVPSVHLDRRMEGSVLLTPTTVTSLALWDVDWDYSPVSNVDRLPSPDIAGRMIEDCPPTPSTCTSLALWDVDWEYSPVSNIERLPSPDIAGRLIEDCPPTPSTCTSWGPPESYPPSPMTPYYVRSPDAGERMFDIDDDFPQMANGGPWHFVWPYHASDSDDQDALSNDMSVYETEETTPWAQVWPYNADRASQSAPCHVYTVEYPHFNLYPAVRPQEHIVDAVTVHLNHGYPSVIIYPAVYPHFDIYGPAVQVTPKEESHSAAPVIPIGLSSQYPAFDIYPAIYPWNLGSIYPSIKASDAESSLSVTLLATYPSLSIYSPVYPFNLDEIYPARSIHRLRSQSETKSTEKTSTVPVHLSSQYPIIQPYPPVYPHNLDTVYPAVSANGASRNSRNVQIGLPVLIAVLYPAFDIYPAVYPWSLETIYPSTTVPLSSQSTKDLKGVPIRLTAQYPLFDIYPAVYPASLQSVYPTSGKQATHDGLSISLPSSYPVLTIYPNVYPYNLEMIYPGLKEVEPPKSLARLSIPKRPTISVAVAGLSSPYARKDRSRDQSSQSRSSSALSSRLSALPPVPPLPANVQRLRPISPMSGLPLGRWPRLRQSMHLEIVYPAIQPYPPVYPYFSIYPEAAGSPDSSQERNISVSLAGFYPTFVLYPPVYPHLEIYPSMVEAQVPGNANHRERFGAQSAGIRKPRNTHLDHHIQAFGKPELVAQTDDIVVAPAKSVRRPRYTHLDLHVQVFGKQNSPSRRELPSPPQATTVPRSVASPPAPPPLRSRPRSGTVSNRPSLPSPPMNGSPSRPVRQLPIAPTESSPTPSPPALRTYGLPSTPSQNLRRTPSINRSNASFSPFPSVPEPEAMSSTKLNSASPVRSVTTSPLPVTPESAEAPQSFRHSIYGPTVRPVPQPGSNMMSSPSLVRTKTLPPRQLPRRQGSIQMRAQTYEAGASGFERLETPDEPPMRLTMSSLAQFPTPPRPSQPVRPGPKFDRVI
ncbi:unnamed protein product [Somion occarium]|uniref:Uncharacterized protein n=1 Tax=Somion occarium TaxID=3059160 RepID=A0ABP1CYD5_9APHY